MDNSERERINKHYYKGLNTRRASYKDESEFANNKVIVLSDYRNGYKDNDGEED